MLGETVLNQELTIKNELITLNLNGITDGLYLLTLSTGSRQWNRKVAVRR